MGRWLVVTVVMITGVLSVSPAAADRGRLKDANDSPGILDIRKIAHRHRQGGRLTHTVRTYEAWRVRELPRNNENYISFYMDDGTAKTKSDRFVWVRRSRNNRLRARLYRPLTHPNGEFLGAVRVWRPDRRSVRISLRTTQLGKAMADGYRWRVTSSFESAKSEGCPKDNTASSFPAGNCIDNTPRLRRSGLRHDL